MTIRIIPIEWRCGHREGQLLSLASIDPAEYSAEMTSTIGWYGRRDCPRCRVFDGRMQSTFRRPVDEPEPMPHGQLPVAPALAGDPPLTPLRTALRMTELRSPEQ